MFEKWIYKKALRTTECTKKRFFKRAVEKYNRDLLKKGNANPDRALCKREYKTSVLPQWKKYGYRPKQFWFELAGSRERKMDWRFIPSDLYYNELLPYLNNLTFRYALQDKCMLDLRFPGVKQAATVCRRMAGSYYDAHMNMITPDQAASLCMQYSEKLFIKPSLYTACGHGICMFDPKETEKEKMLELFETTGANFIVQERIRQHASLAALNPDAVCTLRVVSLLTDDVYVPHMMVRVGLPGSFRVSDTGGYCTEILPNGRLCEKAFRDDENWVVGKEEGLYDDSVVIPNIGSVCETVRRLHPLLPHFKWIGWDFTLNEEAEPVLIEFNTAPGDDVQRVCCRPLFGEKTESVLDDFFMHRTLSQNQLQNCRIYSDNIRRYT